MNRPIALALFTTALLGPVLWAGTASAQQKSFKDQIVGAWILVSTDNTAPDGSKHQIWGPNPTGMLVLDASGRFTQIIVRSDRPKFKANNRMQGSPEENAAAVQGTTATFGSWSVNEADKTLTVRNEGSMFPNQVGTESKRCRCSHRARGDTRSRSSHNRGSRRSSTRRRSHPMSCCRSRTTRRAPTRSPDDS